MEIKYLGHSCFLVDLNGTHVLFDPFITYNELAGAIDKENIQADFIMLSHAHQDHLADAEYFAKKDGSTIVANYEVCEWYKSKGLEKVVHMNIGGQVKLPFGNVRMVYAAHSSVLPDGTYGGSPAGYVIESAGKIIYFAGDTALTYDMKLIGELYPRVDIVFLPVGGCLTMNTQDALIAANWVKANQIIGMHYDTWPNIAIDHLEARAAAQQADKELTLLQIGEKINF